MSMTVTIRRFGFHALWLGLLSAPVGALTVDALPGALSARGGLCVMIGGGGKTGMLEYSWTALAMSLRKAHSALTWGSAEGEQLAYADGRVYAFQMICERDLLWAAPRIRKGGGRIEAHCLEAQSADWKIDLEGPAQVESMVVAENVRFLAGPADRFNSQGEGFLKAVSRRDGTALERLALPAAPVFEGLSAAADGLYIVLRDGRVLMLSSAPEA